MTEFSISKIILHPCHVENNEGESGIGYDMIIGRNLMVHLGISDKFKNQVLQRGGAISPMKQPSGIIGQTDLTSCEMFEVAIQTAEPDSNREANERLVKILDSTYAKADLEQLVANSTQLNDGDRTQLIILLKDSEYLFGGTLGAWDTESVNLELNPDYKPFFCKYCPVPRIN